MTTFIGNTADNMNEGMGTRYFYGLRRTDAGELFLYELDQMSQTDSVQINTPGAIDDNFDGFQVGVDFFEGRDVNHNKIFKNLNFDQYKWDTRRINYYINDDGEFIARLNMPHDRVRGND